MAQSKLDDRIRITHFVNPHVFYFKWKRDCEELDEDLEEIEKKITNIAKTTKNAAKKRNGENIVVSKIVGYFVSDWNKWIRCVVKAKNTTGTFYLWAPDYGLPFTGKESQIIVIPLSFQGMTIKYKVNLGGLINCVPAEPHFDTSTENVEMKISKSWSTTASDKLFDVLKKALIIEFKDIHTHYPMQKPHLFGRLMIQLDNGTYHNAMKCLLNLQSALVSHENWDDVLKKHDSYHQEIWRTKDGIPLTYVTDVMPIKCNSAVEEADDVGTALDGRLEADQDPDGYIDDCLSRIEIDQLTVEDQRILNTSASRIGFDYGGKRSQYNRKRIDSNFRAPRNRNRIPNYPIMEQPATINDPGSNTSRNSNGRDNRNINPVRRNDNYYNNNNYYYRTENRQDSQHQGFEYNVKPYHGPSVGFFRSMDVRGGCNQVGQQHRENQGQNNQHRQTRTQRLGNNHNRSGQFESRKQEKNNPNNFGRLEKINEKTPGGKENVDRQNGKVEKAVEHQKKNVEKPTKIKSEISDVSTKNVNVPASESAAGTSPIKSEQ